MTTATLQKLVRDPRSGEVHLPSEQVEILGVMQNLDRTLLNAAGVERDEMRGRMIRKTFSNGQADQR